MDSVIVFIMIVGALALAVFCFVSLANDEEKKQNVANSLLTVDGFSPDFKCMKTSFENNKLNGIAFDSTSKQFMLIKDGQALPPKPYTDLLECELITDGAIVTKTSRGGQLVGAAVGGVLFGGVGAVVGALSASTSSKQKIKRVSVKFLVKIPAYPTHMIDFIEMIATGKTPPMRALMEAQELVDYATVAMKLD